MVYREQKPAFPSLISLKYRKRGEGKRSHVGHGMWAVENLTKWRWRRKDGDVSSPSGSGDGGGSGRGGRLAERLLTPLRGLPRIYWD